MSFLGLDEGGDCDPCRLILWHRGSAERYTLQAANMEVKQLWVKHIQEVLDAQSNFLTGEERAHMNALTCSVRSLYLFVCVCVCVYSVHVSSQFQSQSY